MFGGWVFGGWVFEGWVFGGWVFGDWVFYGWVLGVGCLKLRVLGVVRGVRLELEFFQKIF